MSELSPALRERIENTIRFLAIDAVERANSGHPGAPMGLARPAFALWDQFLRFDPSDPTWPLRDRFVLSAGHASMLLYSLLHLFDYDVSLDDLRDFRQLGSKTPGHPEYGDTPGVEVTTGPLGQGFAHGVGMALAARLTRARFAGQDGAGGPGDHFVTGIVSDGDMMEGISSEAGSLAGHLALGNLIYLYDDNHITIDGPTDLSFSEDVPKRFEAQRWHVQQVDGQDLAGLTAALEAARTEAERPSLVVVRTTIGFGSPGKANSSKAHGAALGAEEVARTREALGWSEPPFTVPDDVRAYLRERVAAKRAARSERDAALSEWRAREAAAAEAWDACRERRVPADLAGQLAALCEGKDGATRKHSHAVLQSLETAAPFLVGGSADLAESNLTRMSGGGDVGPAAEGDAFAGRNIHFGIREHAMGAALNGIALDGTFRPYGGTFLIFSDYMRPSIRLAALMGLPTIYVFTHDSIFLGEDGPTHQPVEHLDSLRAIPNLKVFRPADGVETALAWAWIVEHAEGPAMLALTRQGVPALKRDAAFSPDVFARGAYALVDPGPAPDVVLVATGSEVALAREAADQLRESAVAARVVSMPCVELFREQPAAVREALLPPDVPTVAIEAARAESFCGLVGTRGLVLGIDRFGASAPYAALTEEFGFTADAVASRVREHLKGR